MNKHHARAAYTLIEIAIVIVIIGLIFSAIIGGYVLIQQANIRGAIRTLTDHRQAIYLFESKFFALPGDIVNNDVQQLWPTAGSVGGNGDGRIGNDGTNSHATEALRAWQHLALAGLVSTAYTGQPSATSPSGLRGGENVPEGGLRDSILHLYSFGLPETIGNFYERSSSYEYIEMSRASSTSIAFDEGVVTPRDAYDIDNKIDDGNPGKGTIVALRGSNFISVGRCVTSNWDGGVAATYIINGTDETESCVLRYLYLE